MKEHIIKFADYIKNNNIDTLITIATPFLLFFLTRASNAKISRLNNDLEKYNHIHKTQFEKEFEFYIELWKKLQNLLEIRMEIIAKLENGIPDRVKFQDFNKKLSDAHTDLRVLNNTNFPFIPMDIILKTLKISNNIFICQKLIDHFVNSKVIKIGLYKFFDDHITKIQGDLANITRNRINNFV